MKVPGLSQQILILDFKDLNCQLFGRLQYLISTLHHRMFQILLIYLVLVCKVASSFLYNIFLIDFSFNHTAKSDLTLGLKKRWMYCIVFSNKNQNGVFCNLKSYEVRFNLFLLRFSIKFGVYSLQISIFFLVSV